MQSRIDDRRPEADYKVGRGKPPLHIRFKKGNPGGRPRHARNLRTLLQEALGKRVAVTTEGGRRRRIARRELGIDRLADKFAAGDPHAIKLLLCLLLEPERRTPPEPAERPPLDDADRIVIENLLARLRAP
jgi:uncharacterized protein DUF5681